MFGFVQKISKLKHWEFWPLWLAGTPLVLFTVFFGIRSRKLFYLTNVNPAFENSALLFSSKYKILQNLNSSTIPKSLFVPAGSYQADSFQEKLQRSQIDFPLIAKPDRGERGLLVEKIYSLEQLSQYVKANNIDFLLQEFVSYPNEIGIFFYKLPETNNIVISSVCLKKFLGVTGDGTSKVKDLLAKHFHGKYQIERFQSSHPDKLEIVLGKGERLLLEPIGNHSRGTEFYDGSKLIDQDLRNLILHILDNAANINYGRFDIKYNSMAELKKLQNFKVIELNGAASEPTHIYDRKFNIWQKYKIFYEHFKIMFHISKAQSKKGIKPMSAFSVFKLIRTYLKYLSNINKNWQGSLIVE